MANKSTHNVLITLGTTDGSTKNREKNDFYSTSPKATNLMVDWLRRNIPESKDWSVWECCCGNGKMAEVLKERGYIVNAATDLINRGYGTEKDFLLTESMENNTNAIITNPPYSLALEIAQHAINLLDNGQYYIFLGRIQFLEGKSRKEFFKENPPKYVLVHSERVACYKNDEITYTSTGRETSSSICYAWYIFQKGYKSRPTVDWL